MFFYIMFYVPYWSRSRTNSRPGETSVYFYCIPFLILSSLKTSADLGGGFSCVKIIVVLYIHKYSKKISIAIFLPRVLMYQKRQISLPVGYKTARSKPRDWERLLHHFRTSRFVKNRFLRRFLIFL